MNFRELAIDRIIRYIKCITILSYETFSWTFMNKI